MIKADKEADVTWRMIILRSRQMVLLRGVYDHSNYTHKQENVEVIDAALTNYISRITSIYIYKHYYSISNVTSST